MFIGKVIVFVVVIGIEVLLYAYEISRSRNTGMFTRQNILLGIILTIIALTMVVILFET